MDKEKVKAIKDNPDLISGIHNYCDRWCERCPLTERCAVFAMEQAEFSGAVSYDPQSEAFWLQFRSTLETAMELLVELAQEAGMALDTLVSEEEEAIEARIGKEAGEHVLVREAMAYMKKVGEWFDSSAELFGEKAQEPHLKARPDLPNADSSNRVSDLKDVEQVILWYHSLIGAKIKRAVRQELRDLPACLEDAPRDSDGSAKVALIAIDRSIGAWWRMRASFPRRKGRILDLLVRLERLRRATEKAFPQARSFVRPGFDAAY